MNSIFRASLLVSLLFFNVYTDKLKIVASFLEMDYVETGRSGEFLDEQTSDLSDIVGFELEYSYIFANGHGGSNESALEFDIEYLNGDSLYNGFLQSGGVIVSPYQTNTKMEIIEPRLRWKETTRGKDYDVSIFTSLGYRFWKRDLSTSPYGYLEEYEWAYADVGLSFLFHEGDWHLGFEGAYQRAIDPKMHAALNGGLDFNLGSTDGYNIKVPLIYDFNKNISLEMSYEYDAWDISASNVVAGYYEPDSTTRNTSVKVGLVMKW